MNPFQNSYVLGQFLGMVQLVEQGLVTPEHFVARCIEIAKVYKEQQQQMAEIQAKMQMLSTKVKP
jgi:hypothetical protein